MTNYGIYIQNQNKRKKGFKDPNYDKLIKNLNGLWGTVIRVGESRRNICSLIKRSLQFSLVPILAVWKIVIRG